MLTSATFNAQQDRSVSLARFRHPSELGNRTIPPVNVHDGHATHATESPGGRTAQTDRPRILWIDDEVKPDDPSVRLLTLEGFSIDCAATGAAGLARAQDRTHDAIIVDLRLPDMFGLSVLERLVRNGVFAPALVLTGYYGEAESATAAIKGGASAFRRKPLLGDELAAALREIIEPTAGSPTSPKRDGGDHSTVECSHRRNGGLGARGLIETSASGIVAVSSSMRTVVAWINRVAATNMTVLLTGETGTGKDLVAQALHRASDRRGHAFVPINCAAIPEGLLEAELFGHRKGAFTGALWDRAGLLEEAHGGTLFLDEIGDMTLPMQPRVLRFLEDGEVRRIGENRRRRVDVRVIAATNRPLVDEVGRGRFRQDLYFRLAVARCHIPPLRDRLEDLEALITYWLPRLAGTLGRHVVGITSDGLAVLRDYQWPGNIRELRSVLEYAISLAAGDLLTRHDVSAALFPLSSLPPVARTDIGNSEDARRTLTALEDNRWNQTRTARKLGISRSTLWRKLRRYRVLGQAEPVNDIETPRAR